MVTKHVRITKKGMEILNDKKLCAEVVYAILNNRPSLIKGIIVNEKVKVQTSLK